MSQQYNSYFIGGSCSDSFQPPMDFVVGADSASFQFNHLYLSHPYYPQLLNSKESAVYNSVAFVPDQRAQTGYSGLYYPLAIHQLEKSYCRSSWGQGSGQVHGGTNRVPLFLDIEAVKSGLDRRTSLMIRNVPNKHTQKSLMNEFQRNGYGPGKIDFFYLPIDFTNKCNRGYAFVNFVSVSDVVSFYQRYHGLPWMVFNSEKICAIMYARIQGKAAFLRRFEGSEILSKDCEFQPLAFVSHGPKKGNPEKLL